MREIKFRVFHKDKMYYLNKGDNLSLCFFSEGIPWGLYETSTEARLVTGDPNAILNTPGTIMQYTGLIDKNKVPIYEVDLIKDVYGKIWDVRFINGCFWLHSKSHQGMSTAFSWPDHCYPIFRVNHELYSEVVGNIHQNKDLLV